ncbi:MAG: trypsin-like peptidase domain-containing protein [Mycobacterium sp.]|uniref:trypsin-like serine peptidase n=1 Tax=Mycobacterium sp. TaxID=1785 RepID=UPI001EBA0ECC|nr:trypsin-like peptidase domain-containing protein [Mycobacterium sp.]MBW0017887.1 trypsin-like peptidase domain-containing protein [Mycobacterium sp.]
MRTRVVLVCPLASLALLLASCGRSVDHAGTSHGPSQGSHGSVEQLSQPEYGPVARPVNPDPRVGAIFPDSGKMHSCTASVVHSKDGDLVLTAAHCLLGTLRASFVPGFSGDATPGDMWTVGEVYFDGRWLANREPRADYAIARVSRADGGSVEARAGSALSLGTAPAAGSRVTVTGYAAGVGGQPIGCQASTGVTTTGFPSLACDGLVGGTSGAPWVMGSTITGVIGGIEGGGCAESMSYSPPFDDHTAALLARAEAGGPGDAAPRDFDDTC